MKKLSPILWTNDLQGTVDFYEQVLGFKAITGDFPNFVSLNRGEVEIMFIVPQPPTGTNDFHPTLQVTGNLYIVMDQVDSFWEEIKDKATITAPVADREYHLRDFSMLDNNGYELVFGQHISPK